MLTVIVGKGMNILVEEMNHATLFANRSNQYSTCRMEIVNIITN